MNWTDEEIDKLFQESASQMNVPYQDAYWTEMEALLPRKEKKKGLGWIFGGTLTCFVLIAAMIFPISQLSVKPSGNRTARQNAEKPQLPAIEMNENIPAQQAVQKENAVPVLLTHQPLAKRRSFAARNTVPASVPVQDADILSVENPVNDPVAVSETLVAANEAQNTEEITESMERLPILGLPYNQQQLAQNNAKTSRLFKSNHYYIQLGAGMSQSYISGNSQNWMPNFNLGAGYQYRPEGFGFSAGLNFSASFASNLEIARRSKVYNFGSTAYEQYFRYRQLYAVELPISVDFRKNRHTVSLGIAPTYLATTVMNFSQLENDKTTETGNYVGQRVGMNAFGLKPSIGYQLELTRSWNLGIQLSAQVIQQIDQSQFVGNATKMPLSGQITIRKTILR